MIKPLNTYILVTLQKEEEKTAGGLYVPQTATLSATDILKEGEVLAVNSKEELIKMGDVVLYNKHAITRIPNNEEQVLVRTEDIYAIK